MTAGTARPKPASAPALTQVVMSGFLGTAPSTLVRRLGTRGLAILPALIVQTTAGAAGVYKCGCCLC